MDYFEYKNQQLHAESIPCAELVRQFGTPSYIYSQATLERHFYVFKQAFATHPHLICYAVKANSNLSILQLFARLGSGFDIVSQGELARVIAAGGNPSKVVFSGVGKLDSELSYALDAGIYCFNVESEDELFRLNTIAQSKNLKAPIAVRINPDVDAKSHPFISTGLKSNKFGIPIQHALDLYLKASQLKNINILGIASHIGSQILEMSPFIEATQKINDFYQQLLSQGIAIDHIDLGGGLGAPYTIETPPSPRSWIETMLKELPSPCPKILIEPGRAMVANSGILLSKVITIKHTTDKSFAIVDCAMNDYLRPALYGADHNILPIKDKDGPTQSYDIVGPICESGDFLGKSKSFSCLQPGDILCIKGAGAYGFTMSSNYNSRPRPPEILVDKQNARYIRERETIDYMLSLEKNVLKDIPPDLAAPEI